MAERLTELLLSELPAAVIATESDVPVVCWTGDAERTFGYDAERAIGQSVASLIRAEEASSAHDGDSGQASDYGIRTWAALYRRPDGSRSYVNVMTKTVGTGEGGSLLLNTLMDSTHREPPDAEDLNGGRFGNLLDSLPDSVLVVDGTGRIVVANLEAAKSFGYEPGELAGCRFERLLPERFRAGHERDRAQCLEERHTRRVGPGGELQGKRKDDTEFPVEISLSPLLTADGTLVLSTIRDVSGTRQSERKFESLLESAPDAMVIVTREGSISLANSQAEGLFGYRRNELLGQPVEMLLPAAFRSRHVGHRQRFFDDPHARPMGVGLELYGQRADGSAFPVEISLSPLETEEGTLVSAAIRDITERKRFEQALQEKNEQLEQANKAKDFFLATMSHELRTPLNAIIGFTGTLLMRLPGPLTPEQEKQLRTVQSSGRHLLALINDLLDVAKVDAGKVELNFEPTSCLEVINEVAATLRPQAERKGLEFQVAIPDTDILFRTDRRALQQIVLNLTTNAIKFTETGCVRLELETRGSGDARQLRVGVTDTGIGIRTTELADLFRAFSRLDGARRRDNEGTGLGLHLSQKLARLLGGQITVHSVFGEGSEFTLELPER